MHDGEAGRYPVPRLPDSVPPGNAPRGALSRGEEQGMELRVACASHSPEGKGLLLDEERREGRGMAAAGRGTRREGRE